MVTILDAILNFSNCSRMTTCHQAVSENRDPWLPKSTVKNLIQQCKVKGKNGIWLPDYMLYTIQYINNTRNTTSQNASSTIPNDSQSTKQHNIRHAMKYTTHIMTRNSTHHRQNSVILRIMWYLLVR